MRTFNFSSAQDVSAALGDRIRRVRLAQNLSQQQLAQMSGSSLSSVRRLETRGQGSLEFVVRVAQALHVADQLDALFTLPVLSIAQAEQEMSVAQRQRARMPKLSVKPVVKAVPC